MRSLYSTFFTWALICVLTLGSFSLISLNPIDSHAQEVEAVENSPGPNESNLPDFDKTLPQGSDLDKLIDFLATGNVYIIGFVILWGIAFIIVNLTPTPRDDQILGKIYKYAFEFILGIWSKKAKATPPNTSSN